MLDLKTLTKVISLYCFIVVLYLLTPQELSTVSEIGKYFLIIFSIVILMVYYKTLGRASEQGEIQNKNLETTQNVNVKSSEQYPEELYEKLTRLIIEASKLVNTKARSAIYIINPKNRTYTLQAGNLSQFTDSIKADSPIIRKYMIGNKKLNQKDYPELWSELFLGKIGGEANVQCSAL